MSEETATIEVSAEIKTLGDQIADLTLKQAKELSDYLDNEYDIKAATIGKTIYPSMDPSIFELKFPSKDIVGRIV